jgi:hypothetical protein
MLQWCSFCLAINMGDFPTIVTHMHAKDCFELSRVVLVDLRM